METSVKRATDQVRRNIWIRNIADRNESGVSIREWCNRNQINETSYYYWLKKIRKEVIESSQTENDRSLSFVPILQSNSPSANYPINHLHEASNRNTDVTIAVGSMTIEFSNRASHELILNVLKVLRNA